MQVKKPLKNVFQAFKQSEKPYHDKNEQEISEHFSLLAVCALLLAGVLLNLAWMLSLAK